MLWIYWAFISSLLHDFNWSRSASFSQANLFTQGEIYLSLLPSFLALTEQCRNEESCKNTGPP